MGAPLATGATGQRANASITTGRDRQARPALAAAHPLRVFPGQGQSLQLWTAQQGNAFFHEIAQLLKCGLEDAGIPCTAFTAGSMADCLRQDDGKGAIRLIIAPHEFYHFSVREQMPCL